MCVLVAQLRLTLATPWTVTCQAPLSVEFSRPEFWSGEPFPSPGDLPDPGMKPGLLHFLLYKFLKVYLYLHMASLVAQLVKNPPAMRETWARSLGWEDPLEKGKATHSSILAWRIPWTV